MILFVTGLANKQHKKFETNCFLQLFTEQKAQCTLLVHCIKMYMCTLCSKSVKE
jgi:hypothetical protein